MSGDNRTSDKLALIDRIHLVAILVRQQREIDDLKARLARVERTSWALRLNDLVRRVWR